MVSAHTHLWSYFSDELHLSVVTSFTVTSSGFRRKEVSKQEANHASVSLKYLPCEEIRLHQEVKKDRSFLKVSSSSAPLSQLPSISPSF